MNVKEQNTKAPMYFAQLEIQNIKCFGKKRILDLRDSSGAISQWTLILGNNGVGKTTLLKSICWMLPVEETDDTKKNEANISRVAIKPLMDDFENVYEYEDLLKSGADTSSRIGVTLTQGVKLGMRPTKEQTISYAINITAKNGKLDDIACEYGELEKFNSPNLYAYSASRHMTNKDSDNAELKNPTYNLFSESGDLYDAEQLLTMLDNASIRQKGKGKASDLLKKVKQILADLLPDVDNPESIIINSPINEDGSINSTLVEIQTQDAKIRLSDLSLGYKTMLAWTVDLAVHMLWRNLESNTPLEDPAVVIIDEIDLHLHPKWQRIVREILTSNFPNTQFISTAHSPIMAQSSELENLAVIKRLDEDVYIENDPIIVKGWRIGQILTSELFDLVTERSPEIEELVHQRRFLLDQEKISEEDLNKIQELDKKLSELPILDGENQILLDQINVAAKALREKGSIDD